MLWGSNSRSHTIETYSCLKTIHHLWFLFMLQVFCTYAASLICLASLPCMEFNPSPNPLSLKQLLGAVGDGISNCPSCGVNAIKQKGMSIKIQLALAFKLYQLFSTNFHP